METAALRIGCKVNLTLRITGVRPNGWHELDTVFLPLAEPSDTLRLALRPGGGLALHCAEPGIDPENNTLTKAYRLFAEASGFRPGVEAVLEKGIPHGAGLGGAAAEIPFCNFLTHCLIRVVNSPRFALCSASLFA